MSAFAERTILVTGAGGGLGSAMVRAFAREGGRVVATDLAEVNCSPLADELGPAVRAAALDVTREEHWIGVLDDIAAAEGRLDVVVNNAGYFQPNVAFEEMALDLWQRHFAVNSDGVFLGCKHGILRMKEHGGAIVNVASGMGVRPIPTASAYCATKAAVLMTTRTAAGAAGRYNIRVNAVMPGAVPTSMLMGNVMEDETKEDFLSTMTSLGSLGRLTTPDDVARSVLFLADPRNEAVTGATLAVDAGMLA